MQEQPLRLTLVPPVIKKLGRNHEEDFVSVKGILTSSSKQQRRS